MLLTNSPIPRWRSSRLAPTSSPDRGASWPRGGDAAREPTAPIFVSLTATPAGKRPSISGAKTRRTTSSRTSAKSLPNSKSPCAIAGRSTASAVTSRPPCVFTRPDSTPNSVPSACDWRVLRSAAGAPAPCGPGSWPFAARPLTFHARANSGSIPRAAPPRHSERKRDRSPPRLESESRRSWPLAASEGGGRRRLPPRTQRKRNVLPGNLLRPLSEPPPVRLSIFPVSYRVRN